MNLTFIVQDTRSRGLASLYVNQINPNKPHEVIIRPYHPLRTQSQKGRYWGMLGTIEKATGNSRETIHEHCKKHFLELVEVTLGGQTELVPQSTERLNTKDFCEYTERVEAWARTELGIEV